MEQTNSGTPSKNRYVNTTHNCHFVVILSIKKQKNVAALKNAVTFLFFKNTALVYFAFKQVDY